MSEHSEKMVTEAQEKLRGLEQKVIDLKKFINQIREFENLPPMYTDLEGASDAVIGTIRSDQFYGQPLATVVRQILVMRKAADLGAASIRQIYEKMTEGGFAFDAQSPENAQRALRISMTKNAVFHKLPSGHFGLSEWYPNVKPVRVRRSDAQEDQQQDDQDDSKAQEESEPASAADTVEASE